MFGPKRTFKSLLLELEQGLRNGEIRLRDNDESTQEQCPRQPFLDSGEAEGRTSLLLRFSSPHGPNLMVSLVGEYGEEGSTRLLTSLLEQLREVAPAIRIEEQDLAGLRLRCPAVFISHDTAMSELVRAIQTWIQKSPGGEIILEKEDRRFKIASVADAAKLPELLSELD